MWRTACAQAYAAASSATFSTLGTLASSFRRVDLLQRPEWRIVMAFAIGLIVGVDRERRAPHRIAGVRTFALTALLGGILGHLDRPGLIVAPGVLATTAPMIAFAAGVIVAATLAFRTDIHRLVRRTLTDAELLDGLTFAVAAVVIWPLLPDVRSAWRSSRLR
jgi:uncharacterized membrane protein (DUF4010 family)